MACDVQPDRSSLGACWTLAQSSRAKTPHTQASKKKDERHLSVFVLCKEHCWFAKVPC